MGEFRMFKYPLFDMREMGREDSVTVTMSVLPKIAHLAMQGGWVTLWCVNDSDMPPVSVNFLVVGTGMLIPRDAAYIGTVMDRGFVWHVFEVPA